MTIDVVASLAIAILIGAHLIRQARGERADASSDLTRLHKRTRLLSSLGYISVTAGVLAVLTYVTTDGLGPRWLHTASLPLAVTLVVGGYVLAAVAGWRKGRVEGR